MNTKPWFESKELLVLFASFLNAVLNKFSLPSFDLTPEFVGSVILVVATLRAFFTNSKVSLS